MKKLADLLARNRRLITVAVLLVTAVGLIGGRMLEVDDEPRNLFQSDSEEYATLLRMYQQFGSDDRTCVVLVEADDLFTPAFVGLLQELVATLRNIDGVESVHSLADAVEFSRGTVPRSLLPSKDATPQAYQRARADALAHPLTAGQLISDDARATLVLVNVQERLTTISQLSPVVRDIRAATTRANGRHDISVRLSGLPPLRVDIYEMVPREMGRFMSLGAAIGFVIAYIVFRRIAAVLIVVAGAFVGAIWALGALGIVGERIDMLNSILPTLVLVVGFTDAVHLMYDFRRSRLNGLERVEAACVAIRHLGPACALTSLTTAVGFGSLALTGVPMIRGLGLACASGVVLALAAVLLVVPLLSTTVLGEHVQRRTRSGVAVCLESWGRIWIRFITHHARAVAAIGLAVTLVLVLTSLRLRPNNSLRETLPKDSEIAEVIARCDEAFGGILHLLVLVEWSKEQTLASAQVLSAMADVHTALEEDPLPSHPFSVLNVLQAFPETNPDLAARVPLLQILPPEIRDRIVRQDRRMALISARVPDTGTAAHEPAIKRIRDTLTRIEQRYSGISLTLTGTSVIAVSQLNGMIRDLARSLGIAALVIFGVMTLALRSIRLGLLTVLPNVFPLALTAAFLVWTGRPLELTTVIVFSICLGVAVDDTIHFVMRYRRELAIDGDVHEALSRTFVGIGAALLTTTAVLVGGFGTVMISAMPTMRLFSMLSCLALVAALIGDLVFLPALLACFGANVAQPNSANQSTTSTKPHFQ